jgi:glycosyltransferase involved in cell wall biosynthesis
LARRTVRAKTTGREPNERRKAVSSISSSLTESGGTMPNPSIVLAISWLRRLIRPKLKLSTEKQLRIALVDTFWEVGGGQKQLLDFAICSEAGKQASVIAIVNAANHAFISLLREARIEYRCLEFNLARDSKKKIVISAHNVSNIFRQYVALRKMILADKIDVVQFYNYHSGVIGILLGLLRQKSKLMIMHLSMRNQTPNGVLDYLKFLTTDAVTYNSEATDNSYTSVSKYFLIPKHILHSVVLPPTVDQASAVPEMERIRNQVDNVGNTKFVGYFGTIAKWKNVDQFIEATRIANASERSGVSYFALIVGGYVNKEESDYETTVRELAESSLPKSHKIFPHRPDIFSIMEKCDVLVLPSVGEPYGRVLIEAMYLKVPFVATDSGGPREIREVGGPMVGTLVPPNDVAALAEAIVQRAKMGRSTHPGVPTKFSANYIIESHYKFVRSLYN